MKFKEFLLLEQDPMMGAPPMGGGPAAAAPTQQQIVIPKEADVWEVLDSILNNKPLEDSDKKEQQPEGPELNNAPNQPSPPEANLLQPAGALMS